MTARAFAPAKINLCLHVGPLDADGFHPIGSLVVFADVGDTLTVRRAEALSLDIIGPFAGGLAAADNLVRRALEALGEAAGGEPALAVTLDKQLPIASGLGGGSADAGAALRAGREALGLTSSDANLEDIATSIGSDGAMCFRAEAAIARGRGEALSPAPDLPPLHMVLANPGAPSPTGAVYRAYDAGPPQTADLPPAPDGFEILDQLLDWLATTRNDLQAPAVALTPVIGETLAMLEGLEGARFVRMSGSGATCFALFDTAEAAAAAARSLAAERPGWWVRATRAG